MIAYVLLECSPGSEQEVISKISRISGVIEVNGVLGKYDVLVKVSSSSDSIESTISQIRKVNVISSHTLFVIYGQGGTIDETIDKTNNDTMKNTTNLESDNQIN